MPTMLPQDTTTLAAEYVQFWEELGIDSLNELKPSLARLLNQAPIATPPVFEGPTLESIREDLGDCRRCGLCESRRHIVFGEGSAHARLVFVGEGPGLAEDEGALPFRGPAGQLLDKILEAMKTKREDVYLTNIVKCRPPEDRAAEPAEMDECLPFLRRQIEAIRPQIVIALGGAPTSLLLGPAGAHSSLRGKLQPLPWRPETLVMPTYHPSHLLKNPEAKKRVWEDMKKVLAHLATGN